MTAGRVPRRTPVLVLAQGFLVLACTAAGADSPGLTSSIPAPSSIEISPSPAVATDASVPESIPPVATLAVDGGDPVIGQLGSYTWRNSGSDSPWLPGQPIRIGAGEPLTLVLDEPADVESWTASYLPPDDLQSISPTGLGDGSQQPIAFGPPPPGRWSVHVSVRFAGGLGSAAYFWLVEVD